MGWRIILSKEAHKDRKKLVAARLYNKAQELLRIIAGNPFQNPPPYEKLVGDYRGAYARRTNIHHRIIYYADRETEIVHVVSMWGHYE